MNEKIKSILEFAITKVRENQLTDCDGNRFVAGTREAYIKGKLERYSNAYGIKIKGLTVDFIYNLVAVYCGIFEPIRRFAIGVVEEGNECAVRIFCLMLCRHEEFRFVARAVGELSTKNESIRLSDVRKTLRRDGSELKLADIKFLLLVMTAIGVLQKLDNGDFAVVEREPGTDEQRELVNRTLSALRMVEYEDQEESDRLLMLFPFFGKEVLDQAFVGEKENEKFFA